MFEEFLQSIDTHIQLHDIVEGAALNYHLVSSSANELFFFGEMREQMAEANLAQKATKWGALMSSVTEVQHYRHNPLNT